MSGYYDDGDRPRRSHRSSRRPVYEEEIIETRNPRGSRQPQMDLVRRRDSDDDIEEVRRDFPPGDGAYISRHYQTKERYAPQPRARSAGRGSYYDDDSYYDSRRKSRRTRDDDREFFPPVSSFYCGPFF